MKAFKLTFLLLAILTVAACDDDEDPVVCGQADWVGTYSGTQTCVGGTTEGVDVTITANGATGLDISYETASGNITSFTEPLPFDGCIVDVDSEGNGITLAIDATLTNGELSFRDVLTFGNTLDCTITATKN